MFHTEEFDVIVIGGGHAGTEAAAAPARMGLKTLLITHNIDTLGQMSCNPAIGGIGKGHLVKEVDALGGIMAQAIDKAGIQFRTLNASKGPAVRATRAQADRALYKAAVRNALESQENLSIFQQGVDDLIIENDQVTGVVTQMGLKFKAKAVVMTVGTFLGGLIHIGMSNFQGGRAGDPPSNKLSKRLRALPFKVGRLKTGTPPRIDAKTVNFEGLQIQHGDTPMPVFSFIGHESEHPQQIPCHITYTNENTHDIIRKNLEKSPMFQGIIEGIGPRYCPSIEDKVVRFADKLSHQIFIEPEGLNNCELYPNGLSTSLPFDVQVQYIKSIKGFENSHITRPGYAIEYDYFDPRDLKQSLETKFIKNLFYAGQINGTTGYEEAAAQGIIAGINAGLKVKEKEAFTVSRSEGYIGVLIDDLITSGTSEPYRMFTSRAEYRLILREDNADLRLTPRAREIGLISDERWKAFSDKVENIDFETKRLKSKWISKGSEAAQEIEKIVGQKLSHEANLYELLKRPGVTYQSLITNQHFGPAINDTKAAEQVEISAKYAGYIKRQQEEIEKHQALEHANIPDNFDYNLVPGLSNEVRQKLNNHRPETISQAGRISGITPAAISILLIYMKKAGFLKSQKVI